MLTFKQARKAMRHEFKRGTGARKRPATAAKRREATPGRPSFIEPHSGGVSCYLDEPPSANRWWRNVRGRMVLSREAREYKAMVALLGQVSRATPFPKGTPVRFEMHWHRGRKSGDLDKRLGVLLDALQGVAYENDSQIVEIAARRDDVPYAFAVVVHVRPIAAATAPREVAG
jgi:crossover junction endodeoxyribonuclease RusA